MLGFYADSLISMYWTSVQPSRALCGLKMTLVLMSLDLCKASINEDTVPESGTLYGAKQRQALGQ